MNEPIDLDGLIARLRLRIGMTAAPTSRVVEAEALIKFARATGQSDPKFLDRNEGPVAPPTYLSTFCADALGGVIDLNLPLPTFLHTDDAVKLGVPIKGGDMIHTKAELIDVFLKHGKRGPMVFQTAAITLTNQHGNHVATIQVSAANFS